MASPHRTQTETDEAEPNTSGEDVTDDDAFADLPPSAKLVHFVLDRDDERTQTQLVDETALSARTVRTALGRLEDAGLVTESICLRDARKRVYSLADDGDDVDIDAAEVEAEA
ncbi:MarR family transcriptional regulator [Halobaculum marinum]|uniref:MarR family transcriptional regulator n=1 Tax=Halobaculum marinum TaxID=3031996 RepID=A0ABD5WZU7_9EURY|nr:helix-turn-helix domain-containing protein [Halobaculum sp. DT55]